MSGVLLRPAGASDGNYLLGLRNQPDVIAGSFSQRAAGPSWLEGTFQIIYEPVGYLRLDRRADDRLEVSIVLSPRARHRGVGTAALAALRQATPHGLVAQIKPENTSSLRAFTRAGFHEIDRRADRVLLATP